MWNFDTECIEGPGSYVEIAQELCRVAGHPDALTDVRDQVDPSAGPAWIEYTISGRRQRWDIELNDDWADLMAVWYVMGELERAGSRFYSRDNGQAMVLTYLEDSAGRRLNELAGHELLKPAIPG